MSESTERLPERLGQRFVLGPLIGRGTCSQVHRAHDLLLDRAAAVKIFPVADDPRVEREVSLLAALDHPSLVGVYDVGQFRGRAFVVMALFEGGSLADRLRHGPLPLDETILAVSAIADALAHVHRAGVLHRDVTPRNILFDADGRAHLSDFGVAFVADSPRITDTGMVVGSAPYLAPEQVRGDEVGPPADIYGLALVMIEALTARPAYTGTPLEAAVARLTDLPRIPPGLGDDLTDLLVEMTADDPAHRPDAESVRLRLRRAALAREMGTPSGQHRAVTATDLAGFEPSRLPTRALVVAGAAALSVLLAGTVVVASTWTVRDVSASSNPPASLSPAASTPLGRALPPVTGDAADSEDSGRSSGHLARAGSSDEASEPAARFWSAMARPAEQAPARSGPAPTAPPASRQAGDARPHLATPPTSRPSGSGQPGDASDEPTTSPTHESSDGDAPGTDDVPRGDRLVPDLPDVVGDVTDDLPAPIGRSSGSERSERSERSAPRSTGTSSTRDAGAGTTTTTEASPTTGARSGAATSRGDGDPSSDRATGAGEGRSADPSDQDAAPSTDSPSADSPTPTASRSPTTTPKPLGRSLGTLLGQP